MPSDPPSSAPAPISRAPEHPRVEIGSIEIFVTQPPAPAQVPASVVRARAVAAPAPAGRLSRPAHPFGFGQS
jgi:hypothetical protein